MPKEKEVEWEDDSSYSRGERGKVEPSTWTLKLPHMKVTVTRNIHFPADTWVLFCPALRVDMFGLRSKDLEEAKEEALALLRKKVAEYTKDLEEV